MRQNSCFFLVLIFNLSLFAQNGFQIKNGANKVSIPFKLINNVIFIPLKVNGVELTFLLDSGVEETVLFGLQDKKNIDLKNIEKISLKGLGSDEAVEGLKSSGNLMELKNLESKNHLMYIIMNQDFNLSSHIGIPVNGIIGYAFLKNNLVEVNYEKKRIIVYKNTNNNIKKIERRFKTVPISIERSKPYFKAAVTVDSVEIQAKLLIDIGNSDALWLFNDKTKQITIPSKNFDDYLGEGFSGDVIGKRAKVNKFSISDFKFAHLIAAFPDSSSLKHVNKVRDRLGSVGGEILKRFAIVFDYANHNFYLKKNRLFKTPFAYNKSGIEISHSGMQWVKETVNLYTIPVLVDSYETNKEKKVANFQYKFQLKPVYQISNIRANSTAAICGLEEGDVIVSINNHVAHKYTLEQINLLLKDEEEQWITMEIKRNEKLLKFRFQLLNIL